jgi:hypothetical protein
LDALPPASPAARFCTDACLCRYLRARAWDVAKAAKMLDASLHWRMAVGIEALRFAEVAPEAATGKMQRLDCADRAGRPVLLMRPGCENTSVAAGQLRFLQWTMEDMARAQSVLATVAWPACAACADACGASCLGARDECGKGRLPARREG